MANLDLSKYGIQDVKEIIHNPSYDVLFAEETKPGLEGFEKGQVTELGAVNVMTGIYTGRSPKDKFFVMNEASKDSVWWTSEEYKNDNKPVDAKCWAAVKDLATKELSNKRLFVVAGSDRPAEFHEAALAVPRACPLRFSLPAPAFPASAQRQVFRPIGKVSYPILPRSGQ